jgi:subtilisin family serine protease
MKYEKLSAGLTMLLQDSFNGGVEALASRSRLFGIDAGDHRARSRVTVFLRTDERASLEDLRQFGVEVTQRSGRVRTAEVALQALPDLTEDDRIERISSSRYLRPMMDKACGAVGLPDFRTNFNLDGTGVIIGVVDTGIDGSHAAFSGRIERVWDQKARGAGVLEGHYGRELTGSEIARRATDENGHGTHVASIAAGNHSVYGGVAPGARLVIVKSDLLNAHIADGIRYIFRVAADLGLPAVVNLSLGGHSDAHDGTDGLSQIIDQECGAGRIVVCAAGNEGNDDIHARVIVPAGGEAVVPFRVPAVVDPVSRAEVIPVPNLNGWYDGNAQLEVALQAPNGEMTAYQAIISDRLPSLSYDFANAVITMVTGAANPDNGDHQFLVDASNPVGPGGPQPAGTWQLHLRGQNAGDVEVHIWALDADGGSSVTFRGGVVQDGFKIGSPGAATAAVTVASYTTRTSWTDSSGATQRVGMTRPTRFLAFPAKDLVAME